MNFICICILLISITNGMNLKTRRYRKLNRDKTFKRILHSIAWMDPTYESKDEVDPDTDMVFVDKECADAQEGGITNIYKELMDDIKYCFKADERNPDINSRMDNDYFFFICKINKNTRRCTYKRDKIDLEAFCISKIKKMSKFKKMEIQTQSNPTPWHLEVLEDAESISGYSGYHYDDFQYNNLAVYVLDEKIDFTHTEFDNIQTKEYLGSNGYNPGDHATHVAGTICGRTVGICRDRSISLYSCGACDDTDPYCYEDDIINCFEWLIAHLILQANQNSGRRAVINYSVGGSADNFYDAWLTTIRNLGGIFVTSAGNSNRNACNYSPAESDDSIAVGAYDSSDDRAYFSNYGQCIDAWGPGSGIYSSTTNNGYASYSGTSMSSPAIAGTVGLLLQKNPSLTFANILNILKCEYWGDWISSNQSPLDEGFHASIGDINWIAKHSDQCSSNSPQTTNICQFEQPITDSITVSGETNYYRVQVTNSNTDMYFVHVSGIDTCFSFYDRNFVLQNGPMCDSNTLSLTGGKPTGNYWLGVSGDDDDGQFTVMMTQDDGTDAPSKEPTKSPTKYPSIPPTKYPSKYPTKFPSKYPTIPPTKYPSKFPTKYPTQYPTLFPTQSPNNVPTGVTIAPTKQPSDNPSKYPSKSPSKYPSISPTKYPTKYPSKSPSKYPTISPSKTPSKTPSKSPSKYPSKSPTKSPTKTPSKTPTKSPTKSPTKFPTKSPTTPSQSPTKYPSKFPTKFPSKFPTIPPTKFPSKFPSKSPSKYPSKTPTKRPTKSPEVQAYVIDCEGKEKCKGNTKQCQSNFPCIVNCIGESACNDATINGAAATDLTVYCSGKDACKGNTKIECGSGDCLVDCSGSTSCEDTTIHRNNADSVNCSGDCGKVKYSNALIQPINLIHYVKKQPSLVTINNRWIIVIGCILSLVFIVNIVIMCFNCNKKQIKRISFINKNRRNGYKSVRVDSEYSQDELNPLNT